MTEAERAFRATEEAIEESRLDMLDELILNGGPYAALSLLPSSLPSIPELSLVEVTDTALTDIAALKDCHALRTLYLENAPLSDLAPLAGLTGLRGLCLSGTSVSDLGPLAGLTGLDWLVLDDCPVRDLTPLSDLASLTQLSIARTRVEDLTPLTGLGNLARLTVTGAQVADLAPVADLTGLLADAPIAGLFCDDIPALAADPALAKVAAIPDARDRTRAVIGLLWDRSA